jgi:hypothetical protein
MADWRVIADSLQSIIKAAAFYVVKAGKTLGTAEAEERPITVKVLRMSTPRKHVGSLAALIG